MRAARIFRSKLPEIAFVTSESRVGSRNSVHHSGETVSAAETLPSGRDHDDFAGASGRWYSATRTFAQPHSMPSAEAGEKNRLLHCTPVEDQGR